MNTTRQAAAKQTAADKYAELQELIATRLEQLKQDLEKHQARHAADPKNWGYPGDLQHINSLLRQANEALGNFA